MESSVRAFPLSNFEHFEHFRHYYPFGNSPAEDFLLSVSMDNCREPNILSLGCGDLRSAMFTIFQNFGFDGRLLRVKFVFNDRSVAVLARNIIFLYLCTTVPEDVDTRREWIASVWSIWYNHELLPQHKNMLDKALCNLIEWSYSWETWSQCPLGNVALFSSPATFAKVKLMWGSWYSGSLSRKSVSQMKSDREEFQFHHIMSTTLTEDSCTSREEGLTQLARENLLPSVANSVQPMDGIKEHLHYLREGTVWAEEVLEIATKQDTFVNPTLFEREDGLYTLHYCLTPFLGYSSNYQYTRDVIGKEKRLLPISDGHFETKPLLANSIQQFFLWLQSTAGIMKNGKVSFLFDLGDSVEFCCLLLQKPEIYPNINAKFDAIYSSNLLDHIFAPSLVLNALPLLKSMGTLFTASFKTLVSKNEEFLEQRFGFKPEVFPVYLGLHCIGQDGQYSAPIKHEPRPIALLEFSHHTVFSWRNLNSQALVVEDIGELKEALTCLLNQFQMIAISGRSVDIFVCILHQFLKQVKSHCYEVFLNSFANALKERIFLLKPHFLSLQTQLFLHGVHMHIMVTKLDCPICQNEPLEEYIQQYSLSVDISKYSIGKYIAPSFTVTLGSLYDQGITVINSFLVNVDGPKLKFIFYIPKHQYSENKKITVYIDYPKKLCVFEGTMTCLTSSCVKCLFLPLPLPTPSCKQTKYTLGDIIKHKGNGDCFDTVISINDSNFKTLEMSKLDVKHVEFNKIMLQCKRLSLAIVYPYPINETNMCVNFLKEKKVITVSVKRATGFHWQESPTFYINLRNKLALPKVKFNLATIERYCEMQILHDITHPTFEAKRCLTELFKHAVNGLKFITLTFAGQPIPKYTYDHRAIILIHGLHYSPVFDSPALDISYCFLDEKPEVRSVYRKHHFTIAIYVGDKENALLKDIFKYSTTLTTGLDKEYKKCEQFDHAVIFPLYPNPANHKFKKFLKFGLISQVEEGKCSYCRETLRTSIKCCEQVNYCSTECKELHLLFHANSCSKQKKKAGVSDSKESNPNHSSRPNVAVDAKQLQVTDDSNNKCERCKKPAKFKCTCKSVSYCSKECVKL